MIEAMLQRQLYRLTPFYASLLPEDDALTKIWSVMPYVKKESHRKDFIRAMNDAGFDGDDLAVRFGRFRMLEDVDHLDFLRWVFVSGEDKLLYAVAEANTVIRNYLLIDCEKEANAVVNECERLKLVDRLASSLRNRKDSDSSKIEDAAGIAIDEFNNHCLCLSALAHCTTFGVECARAQAAAKSVADDEHGRDIWSQQGDLVGLSQRTARLERNQSRHERSKLALDACKAVTFPRRRECFLTTSWLEICHRHGKPSIP
ncbi:unnamed protein product [Cylicostephanus goldi]|uniref:Uncharacterized protein n=1 Tax=Cylicostephanus goldi TaxID=71465 RepID=A0A3P6SFF0_CYLGO|nr:unnamed protein product [Cylicostephanus goldi]